MSKTKSRKRSKRAGSAQGSVRAAAAIEAVAAQSSNDAGRSEFQQRAAKAAPSKPPWHPVPLVELCVLTGLVLLGFGLFNLDQQYGMVLTFAGMGVASLAGLEAAARDHFTGFRSHSGVLAGVPTVGAAAVTFFMGTTKQVTVAVMVVVFAIAFFCFRRLFKRQLERLSAPSNALKIG